MGLANCRGCGKLYVENSLGLCADCLRQEEEDELKIVAYLRDVVDHASVEEIHEATGVKVKVIMRMIQQGRVVGSIVTYPCESCGKPIVQGRLCDECSANFMEQAEDMVRKQHEAQQVQQAKSKGIRMYSQHKK